MKLFTNVIKCGDEDVMYFLNTGWEILASAPNPYPEPYIVWFLKKESPGKFSKEDINNLLSRAHEFRQD